MKFRSIIYVLILCVSASAQTPQPASYASAGVTGNFGLNFDPSAVASFELGIAARPNFFVTERLEVGTLYKRVWPTPDNGGRSVSSWTDAAFLFESGFLVGAGFQIANFKGETVTRFRPTVGYQRLRSSGLPNWEARLTGILALSDPHRVNGVEAGVGITHDLGALFFVGVRARTDFLWSEGHHQTFASIQAQVGINLSALKGY